ncbi:MAG: M81 family metallopeptidase [Casimicrobiaceae bacterium]|nr:M81 family metallopeptidase [Casimicrobiaceae bacterium]MCX8098591.1 M81 family metallopeptidase [Casimicrobiaceae bacterium]MDW8312009.1 M81 family metallopeptidase [Burkholderiales bacterium]
MRIAIGGFQHETNTFAPSKATLQRFIEGGGWPPLSVGEEIFDRFQNQNIPISGFMAELAGKHELIPTAWAAASPSAHVTTEAFEHIAGEILSRIRAAQPDAVYLDLHGAMVTEDHEDGEGELLRRVREVVGPRTPIVVSLDLHANVTEAMLRQATLLVAYRTYPHVDMADTGGRAAFFLKRLADGQALPVVAWRRIPYLIPLQAQCTDLEPAGEIYRLVAACESREVVSASFTPGFPAADVPGCGPMVWAHASTLAAAEAAVARLEQRVLAVENAWEVEVLEAVEAVRRAQAIAARAQRPVVIADTQDNPGAGGESDTMGMVRALLECRAERAAVGLIVDPAAARAAHEAGVGRTLNIPLGGKSGIPGDRPLELPWRVEALADGRVAATGPFYRGMTLRLGPSACLAYQGVRVVVASYKTQLADQAMYRYVGIEPKEQAILVNKSSVHFRADFAPIAEAILVAKAPGPMPADPADLPWRKLTAGLRLRPGGPVFGG